MTKISHISWGELRQMLLRYFNRVNTYNKLIENINGVGFWESYWVFEWIPGDTSNDTVKKTTSGAGIAFNRIPVSKKSLIKKHLTIRKKVWF